MGGTGTLQPGDDGGLQVNPVMQSRQDHDSSGAMSEMMVYEIDLAE